MKIFVIVPTYNEKDNIPKFMDEFVRHIPEAELLVVDDNSPDRTFDLVKAHPLFEKKIHLLWREKKAGLGRAYLAGFDWALKHGADVVIQMDADFSHRFEDLKKIIQTIPSYDFATGSRWVPGGATVNWGILRKIISHGGSFYSRLILGYPIRDWTGGFNAWKANTLKAMDLPSIVSNGYGFQIELKYRASRLGFKGKEVPIVFEDRRVGQSKMSHRIVIEALMSVWRFRTWRPK